MNRLLRRTLFAGSAACCGAILWGASQASAAGNETPVDQVQQFLIGNGTDQGADASILNKQININLPVAVLSPTANGGDVTQSNSASNDASASNTNRTTQTVGQAQDASSTGGGVDQQQSADVDDQTSQSAAAPVENRQVNVNLPVAVLSPTASGGDVTQSNEASNDASAGNRNVTDQAVAQGQVADATASPKGHGPAGQAAVSQDQAADVGNATSQEAQAPVTNEQSNEAAPAPAPVEHGKDDGCGCTPPPPPPPGTAGDVDQSNEARNGASADNRNGTEQAVAQGQAAPVAASGTHGDASVVEDQSAEVANATEQSAAAPIENHQSSSVGADHGKDTAKDGKDANDGKGKGKGPHGPAPIPGDVTQSNEATNTSSATNVNRTGQDVAQGQAARATGSRGGAPIVQSQSAGVANATRQAAQAPVSNDQRNVVKGAAPGSVTQSNAARNDATARNTNATDQSVAQGQAATAVAHGPNHDECRPAPCAPARCPR
jgi:hypothetical protein